MGHFNKIKIPDNFTPVGKEIEPLTRLPIRIHHKILNYDLVLVPAGKFFMGSCEGEGRDDEHPMHQVFLETFYIGVTPISNLQFRIYHPSHNSGVWDGKTLNSENQPVVNISWDEAKGFSDWAGLELPTEAQWEKVAHGGDNRNYPWGNNWPPPNGTVNIPEHKNSHNVSRPVGKSGHNDPYETSDMSGNVFEWCADWYNKNFYANSTETNPKGPDEGKYRVLRGGSWGYGGPIINRSTTRFWYFPSVRYFYYGFRCCLNLYDR